MANAIDVSKLGALAAALPARIQVAAQAVAAAEEELAQVLLRRATGQAMKTSELGCARMALARTQRDLEDLQRIQGALPGLLRPAREPRQAERSEEVVRARAAGSFDHLVGSHEQR